MRVLFVGNSHTYMNDMPYLFKQITEKMTREETEVTMLAYSGRQLEWHQAEYFSLRFALLYGNYDYCVFQQAAHPFPDEKSTLKTGKELAQLAKNCGVTPVFYMTWAEKVHPENQEKMIRVYTQMAKESGALLARVGEVWQKVLEEEKEIDLFFKDGEHASVYGDLLISLVMARTMIPDKALSLPDRLIDFSVRFDDKQPTAELTEKRFVEYDRKKGERILRHIEQVYGE